MSKEENSEIILERVKESPLDKLLNKDKEIIEEEKEINEYKNS